MTFRIIKKDNHFRGILYSIKIDNENCSILFLNHAIDRMKKWNLDEDRIIETLLKPEEVILGHRVRFIAHRRYGSHLLRAVYEYEDELPILVTLYFPYIERYFKGGGAYEDKIFKGC
jgi:hypothetical protein